MVGPNPEYRIARSVVAAEKEDLACPLLTDLACQQSRSVAAVEDGDVGVGLLEDCMLFRSQCETADDMKRVAAPGRPSAHHYDHHLGHETNQALYLEDVEAA